MLQMPRRRRAVVWSLVLLVGAAAIAIAFTPALRWRADVVRLKLSGDLPDIPLRQTLEWLSPSSPVWLGGLPARPNANAAIHNIHQESAEAIEAGSRVYQNICTHCHGADGLGGSAPSLVSFLQRSTDWAFFSTAKWGREGTSMVPQPVSDLEIWQVHAYLSRKARVWADEAAGLAREREPVNVTLEQLNAAEEHPEQWVHYSGSLQGHRYSRLDQINVANAKDLKVAWAAQLKASTKPLSATPIVAGGMIFVTEAPDGVVAFDARTGKQLWRFARNLDAAKLPLCCGAFNRGVAIFGNKLFVGTLDSYLVAIDTATGQRVWEAKVAESSEGYSITSAPLVVDGHVLVGVAGGEFGIRGLIAAFSPEDGRRLWQFDVIPKPGEPGSETWAGDSWKTGGAPTWSTGVYDAERDLIFWTTGNPWPPLDGNARKGDNLYSNSVVALDRRTGKLKWHYQFTPADSHDWDAAQQPILADVELEGKPVPALLLANRNAYYYVLDRRDGRFLFARPFVKQTWNRSFDEKGRPNADPAALPSPKGTLVWPWMHGGTNWWPPSYDPIRKLHFVPTVDAATLYFSMDMSYQAGTMTMGGSTRLATNQPAVMAIKAIDPVTGTPRWSTRLDRGDFHQFSRICGLLSTGGGILFGGFEDRFVILESDTGRELWRFSPGGLTNAAPATYLIDGKQYIAVIAGNVLFVFSLPDGGVGSPAAPVAAKR